MQIKDIKQAVFMVYSVAVDGEDDNVVTHSKFSRVVSELRYIVDSEEIYREWKHRVYFLDLTRCDITVITPWMRVFEILDWLKSDDFEEARLNADRIVELVNLR